MKTESRTLKYLRCCQTRCDVSVSGEATRTMVLSGTSMYLQCTVKCGGLKLHRYSCDTHAPFSDFKWVHVRYIHTHTSRSFPDIRMISCFCSIPELVVLC